MNSDYLIELKDILYDFEIGRLKTNLEKIISRLIKNNKNIDDIILYVLLSEDTFVDNKIFLNNKKKQRAYLKNNFLSTLLAKYIQKNKENKIINNINTSPEKKVYGDFYPFFYKGENNNKYHKVYIEFILKDNNPEKIPYIKYGELIESYIEKVIEKYLTTRKIRESLLLIDTSKILSSTLKLNKLLFQIMNEARKLMGTEGVSLLLKDEESGELVFHTVTGKKSSNIKKIKLPAGKGIAGWIVNNKKAIIVNDVKHDKRFYKEADKQSGFKTKNLIGAPLITNDKVIGAIEAVNKKNGLNFNEEDMNVFEALANMSAIAIQNAQYYNELQSLFLSTIRSIVNAIEAKDKYTKGHSERVTKYSVFLARALNFPEEEVEKIQLAALLHDVGKIGIEESILTKPGKLTEEEYNEIKKHPVIGESIIKPIKSLKYILPGIRNHHERWDGKGYPDGLKGKDIPLEGRIIALADTYDAMTSDRPYRKGLPHKVAIAEIKRCAGSQFDPELADKFIKMFKHKKFLEERILSII